jgi:hypothetical protein
MYFVATIYNSNVVLHNLNVSLVVGTNKIHSLQFFQCFLMPNDKIVIYVRVREMNFPARQLSFRHDGAAELCS